VSRCLVKGGGWYGATTATTLLEAGHDVVLRDIAPRLFNGASGSNPARLHAGPHYCRSKATRDACREHYAGFMETFGALTRPVPVNLYAVASEHSLVDFGTYHSVLKQEMEFLTIGNPAEFGLRNVEGAIQVSERHIVIDDVRRYFAAELEGRTELGCAIGDDSGFDFVVDATFCAGSDAGIDRYEPCLVVLLEGPTDKAVTIVDGLFPSLYPWNEDRRLCSLSSAKFTPFSKSCKTYGEARTMLDSVSKSDVWDQSYRMIQSMGHFFPAVMDYRQADAMLSIRAMPLSAADARLAHVDIEAPGRIRIASGKIDACVSVAKRVLAIVEATA
jgi:hypothetical protein